MPGNTRKPQTLAAAVRVQSPTELTQFATTVAEWFDEPPAAVRFSGSGGVVTGMVVNRLGEQWKGGPWLVRVWVATADKGGPGGTQTVVFTAGTVIQTIEVGRSWDVLTENDGTLAMTVTASGNRWVSAMVLGVPVWKATA